MKKPNKTELIKALSAPVEKVLVITAKYEVLRAECDKIQQALLDSGLFGPIRDLRDTFQMDETDEAKYYPAMDAAYKAAGFDLEPGLCPALIAETEKIQAERDLINAAKPFIGLDANMVSTSKDCLKNWKKAVDLLIGLVFAGRRESKR